MKIRIGLIYGIPASIHNTYISGSGVGSCNRSVSLAKTKRASQRRAIPSVQLTPDMQTQDQLTAHTAKAIVITCIDFRLIDDAVIYFNSIGLNNNYDEFILAGASLGYNQTTFSAWTETLDNHIVLAEQLHDITGVIVLDHMQCGAYKLLYNQPSMTRQTEIKF